jgi:hypothetical protein
MSERSDTHDEGEPSGEPGPSNPPEDDLPSEAEVEEDLPGVPDEDAKEPGEQA